MFYNFTQQLINKVVEMLILLNTILCINTILMVIGYIYCLAFCKIIHL